MGSSLVPPLRSDSYLVMSSLPLGFLDPWQPMQFSLRIGATSLMKLIGPLAACACAAGGERKSIAYARANPATAHKTQQQARERSMVETSVGVTAKGRREDPGDGKRRGQTTGIII